MPRPCWIHKSADMTRTLTGTEQSLCWVKQLAKLAFAPSQASGSMNTWATSLPSAPPTIRRKSEAREIDLIRPGREASSWTRDRGTQTSPSLQARPKAERALSHREVRLVFAAEASPPSGMGPHHFARGAMAHMHQICRAHSFNHQMLSNPHMRCVAADTVWQPSSLPCLGFFPPCSARGATVHCLPTACLQVRCRGMNQSRDKA